MKEGEKMVTKRTGFTIVELLTVMSVIAILIGLLVPAIGMVKDKAKQIQQIAQLHSIDTALEQFSSEFGAYPPSSDNMIDEINNPTPPPLGADSHYYGGAQKLAEALVGLDYLGFYPKSEFRADGMAQLVNPQDGSTVVANVYHANQNYAGLETAEENVRARSGSFGQPFIDLDHANAYRMRDVYQDVGPYNENSVVLCDGYATAHQAISGSTKTGMPILYYRARTQFVQQDYTLDSTGAGANGHEDDIYYYGDNAALLELRTSNSSVPHPLALSNNGSITPPFTPVEFEQKLVNLQVLDAAKIKRPYRASSYILISAGKDGLYGTADDITNFGGSDE